MRKFYFLLLAIILSNTDAEAGDSSHATVIGFSKDGSFFAFERSGTYDGTGFPYSEIFIINTCKNDYATKPIRFTNESGDASEENTSELNFKKAKPYLDQFGIIKGNSGTAYSASAEEDSTLSFRNRNEPMELIVFSQTDSTSNECLVGMPVKKMKLVLNYRGKTQVLQNDERIPKTRRCAFSYSIREVRCFANSIAVMIDYHSPGFEGPDLRQIAVSGCLK